MEKFRAQIIDTFSNNPELVPEEVWNESVVIGQLLKKKFACTVYGEVINLTVRISIDAGIFTQKDFAELATEIKSTKVNVDFDETDQVIIISSAVLQ